MNKQEYLARLRAGLAGLPQEDIDERVSFYCEMIDDRVEEGLSEEEAVEGVGDVNDVISQTVAETPFAKIVKEKVRPKRSLRGWEIALLVIGAPVWGSLLIAAAAVILSLYISILAIIVSLGSLIGAFAVSTFVCVALAVGYFIGGHALTAVAALGAAVFFAGVSIFLFLGFKAAILALLKLTKNAAQKVKSWFVGKERAK